MGPRSSDGSPTILTAVTAKLPEVVTASRGMLEETWQRMADDEKRMYQNWSQDLVEVGRVNGMICLRARRNGKSNISQKVEYSMTYMIAVGNKEFDFSFHGPAPLHQDQMAKLIDASLLTFRRAQ